MKKRIRTLLAINFVVGLTVFFHYIGWLQWAEFFLRKIINPASQAIYDLSVNINKEEFSSIEECHLTYSDLKEELLKNKIDFAQKKLLEDENRDLREQLNFLQKRTWKTVGAEVVSKNIDTLGNIIVINRGEESGITAGNPAIVGDGILVGKVIKTERGLSVVRLINDNQSKIASTVINRDRSLGLVEGGYGISIYLNFIPQNETVNVGDLVVTSGLETAVPKGLIIGRIEAVEKEAFQPFQRAVLTPFLDLNKITIMNVVIGG